MRTAALAACLLIAACGGKNSGDAGDADGGTDAPDAGGDCFGVTCGAGQKCSANGMCIAEDKCAVDEDCGPGMVCTAAGTCEIGGCGGEALDLTYVPPSFLIVLDRSCSMRTNTVPATGMTRWQVAVAALQGLLAEYADDIDWGLTMFPDITGMSCQQDAIPVPVGADTATAISTLLGNALVDTDPYYPDSQCVTNIDTAMAQVETDPAMQDSTKPRFAMLVSDGAQSGGDCGGDARDVVTEQTIADLWSGGVTTFVLGMGGNVDATALNAFAEAGGAPLAGATKYYAAESPAELATAFQAIANLAVSCDYVVDPPPPNLEEVYVFFEDTEMVPRDPTHMAGWDYDPATMTLTFYGSYCERLQTRMVADLDVVFGCPMPPIE